MGYTLTRNAELGERLRWYVDPETPEKPEIDWSDAQARAEHLKEVVADGRAALSLAEGGVTAAAAEAASLLEKIVSDDVEEGPPLGPKQRGRPPKKEKKDAPTPQEGGKRGQYLYMNLP